MIQEKWTDLVKGCCSNHYNLKIKSNHGNYHCPTTVSFALCAFNADDELLVTIDSNGIAYCIDLSSTPAYRVLGSVGPSTSLMFNPTDRNELFIGLNSTSIKVLRINDISNFCLLAGHSAPIINISFYKDYCMTASSKEVIIWQIQSYCKVYQLLLNVKSIVIKKAIFSNLGHVAILYENNLIQSWMFQQFDKDNKINARKYGLKNIKDLQFTKDGRAMIVCGVQNKILVFNTTNYDLLKSTDCFTGVRQFSVISLPLDGGANSIVAVLTTDCTLKFVNLVTSDIIDSCCESLTGIKKILVSHRGHYMAYISKEGHLEIIVLNKILHLHFNPRLRIKREQKKSVSHQTEDNLKYVHHAIKEELKLQRLMPILKEFGEYPEKHRRLIWTTIMELPSNKKAYNNFSNKAPHEAIFDILKIDISTDKTRNTPVSITLSCLLHWCPILEKCSFLPKLIAPFVNVFKTIPILGFEASVFIILNYCQKWFEYHPLPPLNVLGIIENILLEADPLLFNYFANKGITSSDYAWPLLQSTMSEVLGTKDWLIMWDHLLSLCKPWFLLMCTVAYNIIYRKTITTKLQTVDDLQQFYKTQGHVSIKNLLKVAHKLDCETPYEIHPRRYLKKDINVLAKEGPYPPFLQFEFPKYLTDELRGANLKHLKEKERQLRGLQLNTAELMEEKRLRIEKDNFMKSIQEMRLNEIRRCYENQVLDDKRLLEYAKRQTDDSNSCQYLHKTKWTNLECDGQEYICTADFKRNKRKNKYKNCKLLQEQVDRLEFEVQDLLTTLYNKSSRTKSKII
ncbi:PREDICTED: TBC1 domain family member 31 [Ceratosolen solmsi marchali]|uniref:TBC1 domain family member 31 n=1 Tax=Ceratosolen solmsi marchali TaxID=326594 RepID=A0AAJ6YSH1_9HYME|nr:PREDICTED: TBC1 domain family member 31 [Ceratosolen solmsi marchali]